MKLIKTLLTCSALALFSGVTAHAEPALVFDFGSKFDKSFNQAAYEGAQRWAEETGQTFREFDETVSPTSSASAQIRAKEIGGSYKEFGIQTDEQRADALRGLAESGANPIVIVGALLGNALMTVAPEYPNTKFAIIQEPIDLPNVRSIVFGSHEGSYLAGVLAAMASKSGTIGFISGMDLPAMRLRFGCAYALGAKSQNPDIRVIANMIGTTPAAWNDPVRGAKLAKAQIAQGADVIYAAAGGSGIGVLQAAADAGILSIGVDRNQNDLHPGSVLTSVVMRIDVAVYEAFKEGENLKTGRIVTGLEDGTVGYALDEHNAALITDEMRARADEVAKEIIAGKVHVPDNLDYADGDTTCPELEF